jgi:DNA-directed RNA polymerase specialized sigma24 family protein
VTAREYLGKAIELERVIEAKRRTLKKLRIRCRGLSSPVLGDKIKTSDSGNMSAVDKLIDLETEIQEQEARLVDSQREIIEKIQLVYNPTLIAVLTDKYVNGMSLETIAEKMNKSKRTVCVWHGQALQIFRRETGLK